VVACLQSRLLVRGAFQGSRQPAKAWRVVFALRPSGHSNAAVMAGEKARLALMAENETGRLARGDPFRADDFDAWGRQLICADNLFPLSVDQA
jgi:hypothetical protein